MKKTKKLRCVCWSRLTGTAAGFDNVGSMLLDSESDADAITQAQQWLLRWGDGWQRMRVEVYV